MVFLLTSIFVIGYSTNPLYILSYQFLVDSLSGRSEREETLEIENDQNAKGKNSEGSSSFVENPYYSSEGHNASEHTRKAYNVVDLTKTECVTATNNIYYEM